MPILETSTWLYGTPNVVSVTSNFDQIDSAVLPTSLSLFVASDKEVRHPARARSTRTFRLRVLYILRTSFNLHRGQLSVVMD